jgi:hypothetical protein
MNASRIVVMHTADTHIHTQDIQYFRVNEPQSLFHNVCIDKIIGVSFVHGHVVVFLFYDRDKFLAQDPNR